MTNVYDNFIHHLEKNNTIHEALFQKHNVKIGLRNKNGTGVLVGLTTIAEVEGYKKEDNQIIATEGKLFYRGENIYDIVSRLDNKSMAFEETAFLLIFGYYPDHEELTHFTKLIDQERTLPKDFTENMILKNPSKSIMNKIQRSILVLYSYDETPEDNSLSHQLLQSIKLIGAMPTIMSYGYHAKSHYFKNESLYIHKPKDNIGTAANILHMLRPDNSYTDLERSTLDLLLLLHAEHGGGNNSTFTTSVVSSTGTDIYSAIAAAVGSLKGPKHGGANAIVGDMMNDILENCNWQSEEALRHYLSRMLGKEVFDKSGLIYGIGHAVYTLSDPRAEILKKKAKALAMEKNQLELYELYETIERISKRLIYEKKGMRKAANTDFYANLVYRLLEIPEDLYTPLFATARIVGWCAHRIETLLSNPKILRPAYHCIK